MGKLTCDLCEHSMSWVDAQKCRMLRGRLTYPRAAVDGSRRETDFRWLCKSCRKRADMYRRSGGVLPKVNRVRSRRRLIRRAPTLLLGLAAVAVSIAGAVRLFEKPEGKTKADQVSLARGEEPRDFVKQTRPSPRPLAEPPKPKRAVAEKPAITASPFARWPEFTLASASPPKAARKRPTPGAALTAEKRSQIESIVPDPRDRPRVDSKGEKSLAARAFASAPAVSEPANPDEAARVSSTPPSTSASKAGMPSPKAALHVSNRFPKKGRGIRISLQLTEGADPIGPPILRMEDAKGNAYRSTMKPGNQLGEWVWNSGLDVVGAWKGVANARCGNRTLTAKLPPITVTP